MAKAFDSGTQESNSVTRILRERTSRRYFKGDGWTNDPAEAKTFSDVVEAAEICVQYGLNDVELAVRLHAGACDVFCTTIR